MTDNTKPYGLLNETSGIDRTRDERLQRHLPLSAGIDWLTAGWRDLTRQPMMSLGYGFGVALVPLALAALLVRLELDYILFPALAGFMIVAPILAVGLYSKSRILERGEEVTFAGMFLVRARSLAQIFFAGVLLCLLMLLWMRAAVLLYALCFGVEPFPGLPHIVQLLLTEPAGWVMLSVGTVIGGLFAAFGFSISVFSIPMLLDRRTDAFTAMGTSLALVWNNLTPLVMWGAFILLLCTLGVLTAFAGFIVIFPLLGHASWHAYRAVAGKEDPQ